MNHQRFRIVIGAKRQVTLPAKLLSLLSLEEGSQIEIHVDGGRITLSPLVSVPRHLVSESLMREMETRRGAKMTDIPAEGLIDEISSSAEHVKREVTNGQHRGVVKWFSTVDGLGLISPTSGEDVFVRYSALQGSGFRSLQEGQEVTFDVIVDHEGLRQASKIHVTL